MHERRRDLLHPQHHYGPSHPRHLCCCPRPRVDLLVLPLVFARRRAREGDCLAGWPARNFPSDEQTVFARWRGRSWWAWAWPCPWGGQLPSSPSPPPSSSVLFTAAQQAWWWRRRVGRVNHEHRCEQQQRASFTCLPTAPTAAPPARHCPSPPVEAAVHLPSTPFGASRDCHFPARQPPPRQHGEQ